MLRKYCDQNSGIRFDLSFSWDNLHVELGYAKHSNNRNGGCDVELHGMRVGPFIVSPKSESLIGFQAAGDARSGSVTGVNLAMNSMIGDLNGFSFSLFGDGVRHNKGLSTSLVGTYADLNDGTQLAFGQNVAWETRGTQAAVFSSKAYVVSGMQLGLNILYKGIVTAVQSTTLPD